MLVLYNVGKSRKRLKKEVREVLAQWIGEIVGTLHIHKIQHKSLADKLNIDESYVSAILNGKRSPVRAEEKFRKAVSELINEKGQTV